LDHIMNVAVNLSMYLKLISREIVFKVFQPMWSRYLNATNRWRDDLLWHHCITSSTAQ